MIKNISYITLLHKIRTWVYGALYNKMWVDLWITTGMRFITEISKNDRYKERNLFCETELGFFQITQRLKDRHLCVFDGNLKSAISFEKLEYSFL